MHKEIGSEALRLGIDYLIAVNEKRYLTNEAGETEAIAVADLDGARHYFEGIEPGDCVLFKASRSVGLERLATDFIAWLNKVAGGVEGRIEGGSE
jgi:UDP-N-acetylmuramyl pentapeptide synthase